MVTCTGHIGIHEGADPTYGRTLYVRTDVYDVMAIKPNFLTSMGYHIFLTMVLRASEPSARAELRYHVYIITCGGFSSLYLSFLVLWIMNSLGSQQKFVFSFSLYVFFFSHLGIYCK